MSDKRMEVTASDGKSKASTTSLAIKPTDGELLNVPFRNVDEMEGIAGGFRQHMFSLGEEGSVATGAGWGTDFILLKWGEREIMVRGLDLLRVWVETFAPEDAKRFPTGLDSRG